MAGMNAGCGFNKNKKRNYRHMKRVDRYVSSYSVDDIKNKGAKGYFDDGIQKSQQILANIEITAAGKNNGADDRGCFAFELKLTFFAFVSSLGESGCAARAKVDSARQMAFGAGKRYFFLQQCPDFFSIRHSYGLEF